MKLDNEWKKTFNLSGWSVKYDCASDRYKIFTRYVEDGGASISTYRKEHLNYEFYVMKLGSKRPYPDELIIENDNVVKMFVEDGKNDESNDADPFKVSDVNTMLNYLKDK